MFTTWYGLIAYCPEEFNGGWIWPRTLSNTSVSVPCRSADPNFERQTETKRYCDEDGSWSRLEPSTCTVIRNSPTFVLAWFVLEVHPGMTTEVDVERDVS